MSMCLTWHDEARAKNAGDAGGAHEGGAKSFVGRPRDPVQLVRGLYDVREEGEETVERPTMTWPSWIREMAGAGSSP